MAQAANPHALAEQLLAPGEAWDLKDILTPTQIGGYNLLGQEKQTHLKREIIQERLQGSYQVAGIDNAMSSRKSV